jgi:signal-transduction protein with cAMP-binding, CBS, and nucleotidyltransferase domain
MVTRGFGAATRLCDLALSEPVWLGGDATVREVAQAMARTGASAAMIGIGPAIVTEHDVVRAVACGEPGDSALTVAVPEVATIERTAPAIEALATMLEHGIRHLVVVDAGGKPCGTVSLRAAAGAVFGQVDAPPWLAALRVALHLEGRLDQHLEGVT